MREKHLKMFNINSLNIINSGIEENFIKLVKSIKTSTTFLVNIIIKMK